MNLKFYTKIAMTVVRLCLSNASWNGGVLTLDDQRVRLYYWCVFEVETFVCA